MPDPGNYAYTPPNQDNAYGPRSDLDQGWIDIGRTRAGLSRNANKLGLPPDDETDPQYTEPARVGRGT